MVIHKIHPRDSEVNKVLLTKSTDFINFDQNDLDSFKSRVINALGEGSKAVEMYLRFIMYDLNQIQMHKKLYNDLCIIKLHC